MNRRSLHDLAQEPLLALSAMAGAALLALTLSASDTPAAAHEVASVGPAAAAEHRAGPGPRLQVFALPDLKDVTRDAAECSMAAAGDLFDGRVLFFVERGA